ncbi:MFS transporter [Herbiconiux sp. L3-i23]|uniref:MFS transporter n=1 Tax=Herbiconiux sp. L3-i23 TaxID=2905871 RepID=UPI00205D4190|nr:MFS transporter [Herbiconiux sp. L3-i23]BDI22958.1 MFS transporter [Herbiconiux sp. L3-i23]
MRAQQPAAHKGAILAIVLLSYFMILLDNSVIFTALPSLENDLRLGAGELSWVQDAYTLVFGGLLLLGARAGDLLGRRRVFVFGLVVFSAASLLIGLAQSDWWIIGGRALQGVGAAIVAPSSLSLITSSFPAGRERSRAVALYGATAGIGASLGLVVGGALAHWISWRAGFFVNVPIGIAMILLAPRFLPESARSQGRFDAFGAVATTLGIGAIVLAVIESADTSWTSPVTLGALAVGVLLLVALVVNEARAAQPIMPLRLFASRIRTGAYLARMLYMGAMIGFFYFTTQYLQDILGLNPLQAGIGFLPMTVVNFAVAMAIPRITRRFGETPPLLAGVALTLVGMFWLSRLDADSNYLLSVAAPMVVIGAGQGLVFAPLTSAGIAGVRDEDAGAASGLVNTFHQLGMSVGLGVLVAVAAPFANDGGAAVGAVSAALTAGAVLLALCLTVCLALIVPGDRARRRRLSEPPAHFVASQATATRGGSATSLDAQP